MVDPATGIGVAAISAYLAKDGVQKLLGPTTEFLGNELRSHIEKSYRNIGNVVSKSIEKGIRGQSLTEHIKPA